MHPFEKWTVLPHGKLEQIGDGLLTVVGDIPMRMTVVRLADGRLVIYSAIALDEDEMQPIERFGKPTFLIVPDDIHRLDAKAWKDRYPELKVIKDRKAFKEQLERWSQLNVRRIILSHGEIVTHDPAGVLRELAAKLAA